ncbi:MAG: hypothetical protein GW903_02510 [Alphaproteobacteria bacterium]|nr:hypothetical protein [Alphaproteobacteria bacterium]NCQ87845.1 hypothetical protein [Alphaproteobacteria bacterium]NCT05647.1 hypothetical protein [Alphaproteobacteria bacterium]
MNTISGTNIDCDTSGALAGGSSSEIVKGPVIRLEDDVLNIQRDLGLPEGDCDGMFGKQTAQALADKYGNCRDIEHLDRLVENGQMSPDVRRSIETIREKVGPGMFLEPELQDCVVDGRGLEGFNLPKTELQVEEPTKTSPNIDDGLGIHNAGPIEVAPVDIHPAEITPDSGITHSYTPTPDDMMTPGCNADMPVQKGSGLDGSAYDLPPIPPAQAEPAVDTDCTYTIQAVEMPILQVEENPNFQAAEMPTYEAETPSGVHSNMPILEGSDGPMCADGLFEALGLDRGEQFSTGAVNDASWFSGLISEVTERLGLSGVAQQYTSAQNFTATPVAPSMTA